MKSLYLECNAGISGDMLVAALLDLGADKEVLDKALQSIPAKGFEYKISRVSKAGVDCCDFDVILDEEHANHDHDMAFLHGNGDAVVHSHEHEHEHHHDHEHEHEHSHVPHEHHHHHEHRGLQEVIAIIDATDMSAAAKALALKIFDIIADAEAKAHAVEKNAVHFHEVGAIDSIVDIVAIAVCADSLGVENVIVPELCEGRGTVRCQHGVLPVPVPATANIMQRFGFNVRLLPVQGEFVTPTGAAAAAALMTTDELPQSFKILGIGLGAGKRQYERPSILRALLIEDNAQKKNSLNNCLQTDCVCKLETDIDDCSGELLSYTLERLLASGALDAHYQPVFMKKSRPAWELTVICREEDRAKLEALIFAETTTIGIRHARMERTVLPRRRDVVHTAYGDVAVKRCLLENGERCYVEYDSAAKLAQEQGVSLQDIYLAAQLAQKNIN
ncbi:nickel pincer cofactor biosynthesis protein LarC [Phascolarctobacterium succinatutens]|uniref:nickel pincer cofactor biosynthesis protein LarC n=1 Tax=Phascolarctobacterium succinatutens TaxID=626940 RepID=UPI0026ED0B55|nr:nickel pincer cofactor biosynthesis protein LarC [Phascolarctobacterium succinatutens]